jgi:hypothetical protein
MIITLKLESAFVSFDKASDDWYRMIEIDSNSIWKLYIFVYKML